MWGIPPEDGDMLDYVSQDATKNLKANLSTVQRTFRVGAMLTPAVHHIPAHYHHTTLFTLLTQVLRMWV